MIIQIFDVFSITNVSQIIVTNVCVGVAMRGIVLRRRSKENDVNDRVIYSFFGELFKIVPTRDRDTEK